MSACSLIEGLVNSNAEEMPYRFSYCFIALIVVPVIMPSDLKNPVHVKANGPIDSSTRPVVSTCQDDIEISKDLENRDIGLDYYIESQQMDPLLREEIAKRVLR